MSVKRHLLVLIFCVSISAPVSDVFAESLTREYPVAGRYLKVLFRMDAATIEISKNDSAESIQVHIDYTAGQCNPDVQYDAELNQFTLEVTHTDLMGIGDDGAAVIDITLPSASVIDLDAVVKSGAITGDMGDLSIRNLRIQTTAGDVSLDFTQPNRIAMERFYVDCSVGSLALRNLGNTRFSRAKITSHVGEITAGFENIQDTFGQVLVENNFGLTTLNLPRDTYSRVRVNKGAILSDVSADPWFVKRDNIYYSGNYAPGPRSLDIDVKPGMGMLEIYPD